MVQVDSFDSLNSPERSVLRDMISEALTQAYAGVLVLEEISRMLNRRDTRQAVYDAVSSAYQRSQP